MNASIDIAQNIGSDIRTRSFFRRDIERLLTSYPQTEAIDFSGVRFISRSVADEICNLLEDHSGLHTIGMSGDVDKMFKIVLRGRNAPREYPELNAQVIHLNTMQELSNFFEAF